MTDEELARSAQQLDPQKEGIRLLRNHMQRQGKLKPANLQISNSPTLLIDYLARKKNGTTPLRSSCCRFMESIQQNLDRT